MHQLTRRIMNDHALPSPSTQLKKKKNTGKLQHQSGAKAALMLPILLELCRFITSICLMRGESTTEQKKRKTEKLN